MGHYGAAISVLNVALFVSSTACLYLSCIMINIYLLPYLEAVNSHFATVPYLILAIGMLLFLISLLGLAAAATKSKPRVTKPKKSRGSKVSKKIPKPRTQKLKNFRIIHKKKK